MEITYIGHSGFLMEWENCYWLFDYYKGEIPAMDAGKKIFVFVSHNHRDHFNPVIFQLRETYPNIKYILSSDIKLEKTKDIDASLLEQLTKEGPEAHKLWMVKPSKEYVLEDNNSSAMILRTLKSTDSGVAFLLQYQGKTIYHAGDLNLWVWKEETKQYNNNMTALFHREMKLLQGLTIDVAFAPLDPRQEEFYYMGLESLLQTAKVNYVFPMHFWDQAEIIERFQQERSSIANQAKIMNISQEDQRWHIE